MHWSKSRNMPLHKVATRWESEASGGDRPSSTPRAPTAETAQKIAQTHTYSSASLSPELRTRLARQDLPRTKPDQLVTRDRNKHCPMTELELVPERAGVTRGLKAPIAKRDADLPCEINARMRKFGTLCATTCGKVRARASLAEPRSHRRSAASSSSTPSMP